MSLSTDIAPAVMGSGEGVPKVPETAIYWLHKALRNGDVGAEYNLGVSYVDGDGLRMDKALGGYWLRRAAERGDESARQVLEENGD